MNRLKKIIDKYLTQVVDPVHEVKWKTTQDKSVLTIHIKSQGKQGTYSVWHPGQLHKQKFVDFYIKITGHSPVIANAGYALIQNMKAYRRFKRTKKRQAIERILYGIRKQREETAACLLRASVRSRDDQKDVNISPS